MSKSRKRVFWKERDEKKFLRAWAKHEAALRERKRKRRIYAVMSSEMGSKFSAQQLNEKTKNMRSRYSFEIKKMVSTGGSSNWRHFEAVHKILGPAADNSGKKCEINESFDPLDIKTEGTSSNAASPSSSELQHSFNGTLSPDVSDSAPTTTCKGSKIFSYKVFQVMEKNTEILKKIVDDQERFNKEFISMMKEHNEASIMFIEVLNNIGEKLDHHNGENHN